MTRLHERNCEPDAKTINYLKKNLLYCFDPQSRSLLSEQIHRFEEAFFSGRSVTQSTINLADSERTYKKEATTGERSTENVLGKKKGKQGEKRKKGRKIGDDVMEEAGELE